MMQTFRHEEFLPLPDLTALKNSSGETVSVVIPARNEEATIGHIVSALGHLCGAGSLIDEIVVMDDSSEDATASVAREAGARVERVDMAGPGTAGWGKGLALWKSQFVTRGSIVVFVDADIADFSDRFVVGPAGVLLRRPQIELVKASYDRPLVNGAAQEEEGAGGRVTEMLVRPLLNLFLEELSGLRQPLAGEYAARRSTLRNMRFFPGYGVEIGLLLDYYSKFGRAGIAQVDVGKRTHRNRSVTELSDMAFEIAGVFFSCLESQGRIALSGPLNRLLTSFRKGAEKRCRYDAVELPAAATVERAVNNGN